MTTFGTKLARFQIVQGHKKAREEKRERIKLMSNTYRKATAKKLQEIINTATDPMVVIEAANAQAKFLPKPKAPKRRPGTPVGQKPKELTVDDMVAIMEKRRKGQPLTEEEAKFLIPIERARKERKEPTEVV